MKKINQKRLLKKRDRIEKRKCSDRKLKSKQRARWSVFKDIKRAKYSKTGAWFPGILRSFLCSDKALGL